MMQRNDKRYEMTGDYLKSLEELEGRLFYSYNRIGLGYIYNQNLIIQTMEYQMRKN